MNCIKKPVLVEIWMGSKLSTGQCQELLGIKYDAQQKKIHDLIEDNKKKHRKNIQQHAEL